MKDFPRAVAIIISARLQSDVNESHERRHRPRHPGNKRDIWQPISLIIKFMVSLSFVQIRLPGFQVPWKLKNESKLPYFEKCFYDYMTLSNTRSILNSISPFCHTIQISPLTSFNNYEIMTNEHCWKHNQIIWAEQAKILVWHPKESKKFS